jgi:hypothetical protein
MNLDKIHGDDLLAEAQFPQLPTEEQRCLFLACICFSCDCFLDVFLYPRVDTLLRGKGLVAG